jgi:hypothetical protein
MEGRDLLCGEIIGNIGILYYNEMVYIKIK